MPWNDPAGRFSPLKAADLLLTLYPALWLLARWAIGDLGARPITEAIHRTGDWAIRFLILALAVTPARAVLNWPRVVLLRRMLGVAAAAYAGLHLLLYVADQKWNLWTVASEIVLRFYLTIGFVVVLALAALAITSTDGWQRHLRQRWKQLHRLVFPATALALFHYALQSKINVTDALAWSGLFVWLALWRRLPRPHQTRLGTLLALSVAAALATVAIEVAWYGLATKVDPWRVLTANLGFDLARRPASRVLVAGLALVALAAARRALAARRKPA
jgi:sulfoxide reductase heme-binding subunit YedZ